MVLFKYSQELNAPRMSIIERSSPFRRTIPLNNVNMLIIPRILRHNYAVCSVALGGAWGRQAALVAEGGQGSGGAARRGAASGRKEPYRGLA